MYEGVDGRSTVTGPAARLPTAKAFTLVAVNVAGCGAAALGLLVMALLVNVEDGFDAGMGVVTLASAIAAALHGVAIVKASRTEKGLAWTLAALPMWILILPGMAS